MARQRFGERCDALQVSHAVLREALRVARDGDGLKAGQMHNTGTATEIYWVTPGDELVAEFAGLGTVALQVIE